MTFDWKVIPALAVLILIFQNSIAWAIPGHGSDGVDINLSSIDGYNRQFDPLNVRPIYTGAVDSGFGSSGYLATASGSLLKGDDVLLLDRFDFTLYDYFPPDGQVFGNSSAQLQLFDHIHFIGNFSSPQTVLLDFARFNLDVVASAAPPPNIVTCSDVRTCRTLANLDFDLFVQPTGYFGPVTHYNATAQAEGGVNYSESVTFATTLKFGSIPIVVSDTQRDFDIISYANGQVGGTGSLSRFSQTLFFSSIPLDSDGQPIQILSAGGLSKVTVPTRSIPEPDVCALTLLGLGLITWRIVRPRKKMAFVQMREFC